MQTILRKLLRHDVWTTSQLLELCRPLSDEQLDREFDIGHRTLRATFDHVVHNMEVWPALMSELTHTRSSDRSVDGLLQRLEIAAKRLLWLAESIDQRGAWDTTWVDSLDDPPQKKSYATTFAHVVTHGMHHRAQLFFMMRCSGIENLPEGDVFSWETATQLDAANRQR